MDINIGDKFLVPTRGNDPFHWNFEYDESVVEATVVDPLGGLPDLMARHHATKGVFWDNPNHGYIVLMQTSDGYFQWLPVDELRPIGSYKYKIGDVVRVLENQYTSGLCPVSEVGRLAYVTDVMRDGCQLSLHPDSHPDEHSERSLFFMNHEFEPYEG